MNAASLTRPLGTTTPKQHPYLLQVLNNIGAIVNQYLTDAILCDRIQDLPQQFETPQVRRWGTLDWQNIDAAQIVGIDPLIFIAILAGSVDTELPIRGYTQTSRQYLEKIHTPMARFVGGAVDEKGCLIEAGLWEKEERQHAPALQRVYTQLTGLKLRPIHHEPRAYQPTGDFRQDLYHHGLHRVATEYGATCLYLWLMAHSTGALQAVLAELLRDEINHMTKFWGFGLWAYPDSSAWTVLKTLAGTAVEKLFRRRDAHGSLIHTLRRMAQVLHWSAWSWGNKLTFLWTFAIVLWRLWSWSRRLPPDYLESLLGRSAKRA
ncbi:MAG: ferritin-like domain-containing protein [Thermosynechococcaceae cyanobacterium]